MPAKPDYHHHEEFILRSAKLKELRQLGVDPYPHQFHPSHTAHELLAAWEGKEIGDSEAAQNGSTPEVSIAGRLVLFRAMGKNAFAQIQDGVDRIQVMFNRDLTEIAGYAYDGQEGSLQPIKVLEKKFDLGDIIGVRGNLFYTHKGELTVFAKEVTLLSKSLLPLADKHSGLADKETRYRKRWLDLIASPKVQKTFRIRSQILTLIRQYCYEKSFLEVETPVLQSIYGGAEAKPFVTNLHALDQNMFLRISLEIPLKKLLVGGISRIFEIGRVFRNEGIDRNHNPEFTLMEAYAAYWDYNDMMTFTEELFDMLATKIHGTTKILVHRSEDEEPVEIDLKAPWKRMTMVESLKEYAGVDVESMSDNEMRQRLKESGHIDLNKLSHLSRGLLIAALFEVEAEPHLIQPHHIYDHPIETTPLCKLHRDPAQKEKGIVERFESFILGQEMCNAYSELNDPEHQRELLELQAQRREAGDEEASPFDEEFIEAICQGMPPAGGVGIGLDRLIMLLTNSHSIRDVLFFPWMKPLQM